MINHIGKMTVEFGLYDHDDLEDSWVDMTAVDGVPLNSSVIADFEEAFWHALDEFDGELESRHVYNFELTCYCGQEEDEFEVELISSAQFPEQDDSREIE